MFDFDGVRSVICLYGVMKAERMTDSRKGVEVRVEMGAC